jgi:hypothetical protein
VGGILQQSHAECSLLVLALALVQVPEQQAGMDGGWESCCLQTVGR